MEETQELKKENFISRFFHIRERNGKVSNEILGGVVVFLAMCYILPVNASILSNTGMSSLGVFASTAIVSAIATILMGLIANCPIALSAGMGLNAYLSYTVCGVLGYNWQECLILLTITGILFFIFSLTPIRRKIIDAFPIDLKSIISAGLGAFIAFVGLKGSGIIASDSSTLVTLVELTSPVVIITIIRIFHVLFLMFFKTKRGILSSLAVPIGMLATALLGYLIWALTGADASSSLPHADFTSNWGAGSITDVIFYGLIGSDATYASGSAFADSLVNVLTNPISYAVIFSMIFVNMFDTTATLMAVGRDVGIMDENGKMTNNRAIIADATGALICAPLGTSTVTSFAESTIGVKIGARTGLSAIVTGLLFLLAAFIYPIFELFTYSCVSCAALVSVGALIFVNNLQKINWKDAAIGFSAFITVMMIVLTYSLTDGIGFGLLTYIIIMLATRRGKEVNWIIYVVTAFYIVCFAINAIVANT